MEDPRKIRSKYARMLHRGLWILIAGLLLWIFILPQVLPESLVEYSFLAMCFAAGFATPMLWIAVVKGTAAQAAVKKYDDNLNEAFKDTLNGLMSYDSFKREVFVLTLPGFVREKTMEALRERGATFPSIEPPPGWEAMESELLDMKTSDMGVWVATMPQDQRRFITLQVPLILHKELHRDNPVIPVLDDSYAKNLLEMDHLCTMLDQITPMLGEDASSVQEHLKRMFEEQGRRNHGDIVDKTLREIVQEAKAEVS